jgi:hypothetical protein
MKKVRSSNLNISESRLQKRILVNSLLKKYLLGILLVLFLFINQESCKKEPPSACGVENPQDNIQWLKTYLESVFTADVYKITFKDTEYIVIDFPSAFDSNTIVYNCQGIKLCEYMVGGMCNLADAELFWEHYAKNKILIYECRNTP